MCLRLERGLECEVDGAAILEQGLGAVLQRERAGGRVSGVVAEEVDELQVEAVLAVQVHGPRAWLRASLFPRALTAELPAMPIEALTGIDRSAPGNTWNHVGVKPAAMP